MRERLWGGLGIKRRSAFLEWIEQRGDWWAWDLYIWDMGFACYCYEWPVHTLVTSKVLSPLLSPTPLRMFFVIIAFHRNRSWGFQLVFSTFVTGEAAVSSSDISCILLLCYSRKQMPWWSCALYPEHNPSSTSSTLRNWISHQKVLWCAQHLSKGNQIVSWDVSSRPQQHRMNSPCPATNSSSLKKPW